MSIHYNQIPYAKIAEYRQKLRAWERAIKAVHAAEVALSKAHGLEDKYNKPNRYNND